MNHEKGLPVAVERQTVQAYLERWLSESASRTIRQGTLDSYTRLVRLHATPYIGKKILEKLSPQDVSSLYDTLLKKDLSPRTVQYVHAILYKAMKQAMRWGLIARNPVELVDAPRVQRKEIVPLDTDGISRFLEAAMEHRLFALYILAVAAGCREGELLGLKWPDIDWEAGSVGIRRQVVRDSKNGLHLADVKTAKGRRTVTLPAIAVEALRAHQARQAEERLALGTAWNDNDLVFPNSIGKPYERQNFLRQCFTPLLDQAGLPDMRFHDLRHSNATLLLSLDVHPKVVQERLGHSTIGVTMDTYSHVMPAQQREAADKLDEHLRKHARPKALGAWVSPGGSEF